MTEKLKVGARVSCYTTKQVEGTVTAILAYSALTVRVDGEEIDRGFNRSTVALIPTKRQGGAK